MKTAFEVGFSKIMNYFQIISLTMRVQNHNAGGRRETQHRVIRALTVNTWPYSLMSRQHGIKHMAAINSSKHWLRTVIVALCIIPYVGHIDKDAPTYNYPVTSFLYFQFVRR